MTELDSVRVVTPCECGQHRLEARYDFKKVGDVVTRTYLMDLCAVCGHKVPRTMSLKDQLECGIVTPDEVRSEDKRVVALGRIKRIALHVRPDEVKDGLASIVRLCIDGMRP